MTKLSFDIEKLSLININEVIPNDWNPKDSGTSEYQKIKKSIETIGLNEAIKVREFEGKYQVLDGMQRYSIAKELGLEMIPIYNEGIVSDQRAREHTIWKQLQVPFNKEKEAELILAIQEMGEPIELPYNEVELEEFKNISLEESNEEMFEENSYIKTLSIKMLEEQYEVVMKALNKVKEMDNCTDSQAIERICADYLAGV